MKLDIISMEFDQDINEYVMEVDLDEEALKFFTDLGNGDPEIGLQNALKEAVKEAVESIEEKGKNINNEET